MSRAFRHVERICSRTLPLCAMPVHHRFILANNMTALDMYLAARYVLGSHTLADLQATVREALQFSARLRLPRSVSQAQLNAFVDEVRSI